LKQSTFFHLDIIEAKIELKLILNTRFRRTNRFFRNDRRDIRIGDKPFILDNILNPNFEIKYSALKILKELSQDEFNSFKDLSLDLSLKFINFVESN
jgi:hypothetical protein